MTYMVNVTLGGSLVYWPIFISRVIDLPCSVVLYAYKVPYMFARVFPGTRPAMSIYGEVEVSTWCIKEQDAY